MWRHVLYRDPTCGDIFYRKRTRTYADMFYNRAHTCESMFYRNLMHVETCFI